MLRWCLPDDVQCQIAEAPLKVDDAEPRQDVQLLQVGLSSILVDHRLGGPRQAMVFDGNGIVMEAFRWRGCR